MSGGRKEKRMTKEERLMKIELEYMEKFERGQAPSLEELVETYPDMREELAEFVLDYVSLEAEADEAEPSEDAVQAATMAERSVLDKVFAEPESLVEARKAHGEKLGTLAPAVNLPKDVLRALEKGAIVVQSVPANLFNRLSKVLGLVPERIRDLIERAEEPLATHNRAQGSSRGEKRRMTFEEALRESPDLNDEHIRDWLPDRAAEQKG